MTQQVWVSHGYIQSKYNIFFDDLDERANYEEGRVLSNAVRTGKPLDRRLLPERIYYAQKGRKMPLPLPPIFHSRYIFFSESTYEKILHLNFGKTFFFPVEIYDENRVLQPDLRYYGVALAEARETLIGGSALIPKTGLPGTFSLNSPMKHGQVLITNDASGDVDLWVDPKLRYAIFLSDAFYQVLREMKELKFFRPYKCAVYEGIE